MKIAIIDRLGLCYDGDTLKKRGLGGSESAVILMSKELVKIGFDVTVFNNCIDSESKPGIYDGVKYVDNTDAKNVNEIYDFVIVTRTIAPFVMTDWPFIHTAKKRILWLHDTFIEGDQQMEGLVVNGKIDYVFTLSDWHTSYILTCDHGHRRNHEVLKKKIFQTRNGAVCHIPEVDLQKKDPTQFVYNASATKGLIPLVEKIWPRIKERMPQAKLTVIGGYYRFREGAEPDAQEKTVRELAERKELADMGVTFTGVIRQDEIAEILSKSWMMLYPGAFPETFGISSLESLLYKTPLLTTRFGALEETAVDKACYHIDYAIEPNGLFPNIDHEKQVEKYVQAFFNVMQVPYLHQQKQNYCEVVKDVAGWDTVALQWKQFLYKVSGEFLPVDDYRAVTKINDKVTRVFGRTSLMPAFDHYTSYGKQRRIVVVSPFWNAGEYVKRNILSVAQQEYDNFHHILIDDASTDNSYQIAADTIESLSPEIQERFELRKNSENKGSIFNQLSAIRDLNSDDIVMLLDGDDWIVNNNTIFHYYNDLYSQGYEYTYGSMHSLVDNIDLISQTYPEEVRKNKSYRSHHFNWIIPYTHLRTFKQSLVQGVNEKSFKDEKGEWMKSGADTPLFYELIEQADPEKIYCVKEVVAVYNDVNPLNDYKIHNDEQNKNAKSALTNNKMTIAKTKDALQMNAQQEKVKSILIAIPTNKYIEPETMKSIFDLEVPPGYKTHFQFFYGYQIDQIRNLIANWAKAFDYLFSVDSDMVLPSDTLTKMLASDKDIISGLYIQRIPNTHTLEVYMDTPNGGCTNIPYDRLRGKGIVEIAACGMGCALIKGQVFRTLEYPHFYYQSALSKEQTVSEDVYFCLKARKAGFKVWADETIHCDHKGTNYFRVIEKSLVDEVAEKDLLPMSYRNYINNLEVEPKVVYDIGACVRHWTRHAQKRWAKSKFYLIDANEEVKNVLAGDDYAIAVLSDQDGRIVDFYHDRTNFGGNSYYKETTGAFNETHKIKKISITLDTLIEQNGWQLPDMIKLDVQGSEMDILRGAPRALENCKDILLEAQFTNYNEGAPKFDQVKTQLEDWGFKLVAEIDKTNVDGNYHFSRTV